jgi:prenyltransferase beta subunit
MDRLREFRWAVRRQDFRLAHLWLLRAPFIRITCRGRAFDRGLFAKLVASVVAFVICARPVLAEPQIDRSTEAAAKELITTETQQAIDGGLAYLAARQDNRDGSFGSMASSRRRVAVTALAGMAFLSSGNTPGRGKYGAHVQRAVDFLLSRVQPNGFIFDEGNTGHGPMYDHGFATLFLAEVYGMTKTPRVRDGLQRAVQLIINSQNKEGGWRYEPDSKDADLSVTICQVMALRAARNSGIFVPKETIDRCIEYVRKCQTIEGGFRYQLSTTWQVTFGLTAAGVVALYSAGVYEGKSIESGLRYLERFRPGMALRQPSNHYFYSHYYAVQAMWHAGGDRWKQWYPEVRDELLQFPYHTSSGGWRDPSAYGDEYATAMALIILQTPNNYLPIFQR